MRRCEEVENAFQELKTRLINAPILVNPEKGASYLITSDASDFAMGAVIDRISEDGVMIGTIAFFFRSFFHPQREIMRLGKKNYSH